MKKTILMLAIAVFGLTTVAQATLTQIGTATYNSAEYNLVHDDDLGIIWLDYSSNRNYWEYQVAWASGLNGAGVLTYNLNAGITVNWGGDWRLPNTLQPDPSADYQWDSNGDGINDVSWGYNATGSEMGHLYYTELGNAAGGPLSNTGPFQHLLSNDYWSGTEYSLSTRNAWSFYTSLGLQFVNLKGDGLYALAVRPGDVVAAQHTNPVPEPGTWMLLGSGLVGLAAFRRKFARR